MESTTPNPSPAIAAAPAAGTWPREPRRLPAGRGASWWSEGWKVFTAAPLPWLIVIVLLAAVNVVLHLIPFVGSLAATVLGPVFAGGLLLGCHALAQGRPLEITHLFQAFQSDRLTPLAILGLVMLGIGIVLFLTFGVLAFGGAGAALISGAFMQSTDLGALSAMAGMGLAALFAGLAVLIVAALFFMAWWFAPALVTLNRAPPIDALQASFRASVANFGAQLVFGLIFIGLAIAASIPFGLGWFVLGPVAVGASYASWREVYGD